MLVVAVVLLKLTFTCTAEAGPITPEEAKLRASATSLLFPACSQLYQYPHIPSNTAKMFGIRIASAFRRAPVSSTNTDTPSTR